jgi:hypothetical protein
MSATPQVATRLRPLGVGEILDAGFRLVRRRFGTLVVCTLAVAVPLTILRTFLLFSTNDAAFEYSSDGSTTATSSAAVAGTLIANVLQYVMLVLVIAACFRAVSAAYLGREVGAGESLRFAVGRMLPLLAAMLLVSLAILLAFVLLILPAIWLGVRLSVTFPAIVFERLGPLAGMRRSFRLVRGSWWRTCAVLLVTFALMFVLGLAFGAVIGVLGAAVAPQSQVLAAAVVTAVDIALTAVLYPVWAAISTVLYYDLRVRKEGFDLELLAQGVGAGPAPAEPAGAWSAPSPSPSSAPPESFGGFLPPEQSPERP